MSTINNILAELDEGVIASQIGSVHDNARAKYQLTSNTIADFDSFVDVIADYYNYHFQYVYRCGPFSESDAQGKVKDLLNQAYRQHRGDIMTAFRESRDNVNGGLRTVLDTMADAMKAEHIEQYITNVFDKYINDPDDFETMAEIAREFMAKYGQEFRQILKTDKPEFYARDIKQLIKIYVDILRQGASSYRRI